MSEEEDVFNQILELGIKLGRNKVLKKEKINIDDRESLSIADFKNLELDDMKRMKSLIEKSHLLLKNRWYELIIEMRRIRLYENAWRKNFIDELLKHKGKDTNEIVKIMDKWTENLPQCVKDRFLKEKVINLKKEIKKMNTEILFN